jgi:hypothetical protein
MALKIDQNMTFSHKQNYLDYILAINKDLN